MSTNEVNEDSNSANAPLDEFKHDTDEFLMTGQELRFQDYEKDDTVTGEYWLEMHEDVIQFLNSETSNTSNGFNAALDSFNRDRDVVGGSETGQELRYEESMQAQYDDPIPAGSYMEVNADKEIPLISNGMPLIFSKSIKQEPDDIDYDADTIPVGGINVEREIPEDIQGAENREESNLLFNEDAVDVYDLPAKNFAE